MEDPAARTVRRRYLAVVLGVPDPASGRVNAPIGRDPRDRLKMGVVHGRGGGGESCVRIVTLCCGMVLDECTVQLTRGFGTTTSGFGRR